jgi:hypothetical protein
MLGASKGCAVSAEAPVPVFALAVAANLKASISFSSSRVRAAVCVAAHQMHGSMDRWYEIKRVDELMGGVRKVSG